MKSQKSSKSTKAVPESTTADLDLQNEISAFASQLGLTAATQNGFNDSDFRPEVATQPIGQKKKKKAPQEIQLGDAKADQNQQRTKSHQHAGPSGRSDKALQEEQERYSAVKGRKWNFGSGIRPGEKAGKTLLGRDEPTIWHEALKSLSSLTKPDSETAIDVWALEKLRNEGEAALENEAKIFETDLGKRNKADSRWLQQVKQSGTSADKLAALTLLIQESAVANLRSLDELLKWVGKRSGARGIAGQAVDALKELFTTVLLPSRKLLFFEQQPLAQLPAGNEGRRYLMYFYMEDSIKKRYVQFVKDLQEATRDNLAFIKEKGMKAIFDLLKSNPEQEALLLSALVDKLGDPSRKIASNAGYFLGQLLEEHPAMSLVVVQETERFLFKPFTSAKAVYYSVVFLNQIVLTKRRGEGGSAVAKKLISLYFTLFKLILEGKIGQNFELQSRKEAQDTQKGGKKGDKKKQRWKPRPGSKKTAKKPSQDDRKPDASQVAAVDAKLLGALLAGVRRAFPFVDPTETEALMEQHSTSLFTVTHTATFGVAVQSLSLVFQLLDARSAVSDRFYRALYGLLLHPELGRSNKTAMFLSLLYKAMKADVSLTRVIAFMKRILQVAAAQAPNFTCGCLLLISEVMKEKGSLWSYITEPEDAGDANERLEAQEVPSQDSEEEENGQGDLAEPRALSSKSPADLKALPHQAYDILKRDPKYTGAERTCVWELVILSRHVHPSVVAMSKALLAGVPIDYAGDPIKDMSTSAFLDRFIQKKPKVQAKGTSLMQPIAKPQELTPAFAALSAADAAPETAYFHKFFEVKAQREAAGVRPSRKKKKSKDEEEGPLGGDDDSLADSDAGSEEIDEFMEQIEVSEDEGGDAGYEQLAAAMAVDGPLPDDSSGSEAEEDFEGTDQSSQDDQADSASEGEVPEDLDVFDLGSPSEGGSEESLADSDDNTASEGEWIMADPTKAEASSGQDSLSEQEDNALLGDSRKSLAAKKKRKRAVSLRAEKSKGKKGKAGGDSVFAAAEDYEDLIAADKPPKQPKKASHRV